MLMLARAARQGPWVLPPRVEAEAIQQEARAEAMLGTSISVIAARLDQARGLLAGAQPATAGPGSTLAAHYGTSLLAMQMAICHHEAGQPARAVEIYGEYLTADAFSRRDYGYFRALAGIASASAGRTGPPRPVSPQRRIPPPRRRAHPARPRRIRASPATHGRQPHQQLSVAPGPRRSRPPGRPAQHTARR
jgi:hypothetical protein